MQKTIILLLALLAAGCGATAQSCLPEGITFSNQVEIDNFQANYPGCQVIEGDVLISLDGISNLQGLSAVRKIAGNLRIWLGSSITSLQGLHNIDTIGGEFLVFGAEIVNFQEMQQLRHVGGLYIGGNPALTSLAGLENIQVIPGDLSVVGASQLTNLSGLDNLQHIGGTFSISTYNDSLLQNLSGVGSLETIGGDLVISGNARLPSIIGLNRLRAVGGLVIQDNNALTDLSGLDSLATVENHCLLSGNSALLALTGLQRLRTVGGNFGLNNNPALVNCLGLESLQSVGGDFMVTNNAGLQNLIGFDSLRSIGDSLTVSFNPSLVSLSGMPMLDSIGDAFRLSYHDALTHLGSFDRLAYIGGNFYLQYNPLLAQLTGLEHLQSIGGHFIIDNTITDLQGLDNLTFIGGNFNVHDALTSFHGAENLAHIGGNLTVIYNPVLTNFEGLNQLATVGGNLYVNQTPMLQSLSGLEKLVTVGGDLILDNQSSLTSVQALSSLTSIGGQFITPYLLASFEGLENLQTIGSHFGLEGNWHLTDFTGLENLSSIGGAFYVRVAQSLTSFKGLESLQSIGLWMRIEDNPVLASLKGLDNLVSIGPETSFIDNNPNLSECAIYGICSLLFNNDPNGAFLAVYNNGPGCDSYAQVVSRCNTIPVQVQVLLDHDGDCLAGPGDVPAPDVQVRLVSGGQMGLRASDAEGLLHFRYFNTGPFTLYLPQYPSANWAVCKDDMVIDPGPAPLQDTIKATFILAPVQQECASLEVTLGMPSNFRGCFATSEMEVSVRNTGNILTEDVILTLVKPVELNIVASNPPFAQQNGDTLYFELGDMLPFAAATVKMTVKTNCNYFLFERTLCVEAFARTLLPCPFPPPPSSEIKLTAQCLADTVLRFTIKNIGNAPTSTPHDYRLIRNEEVFQTGNFSLMSQQSMTVDVQADGATYRMEATKYANGTLTAVALENCGGLTPFLVNAFWLDRGPPEYDFACREVVGAFDPNQKTAAPTGVGPEQLVEANTPFEYTIDFQNTGTDTAFRVLLLDVLPQGLDINTFRPIAASHEHSWEIRGMDTLEVLYFPIALPDSNVNEPASHGFFTFAIQQLPDLPDGTVFENKASIIFDFNPPIVTNIVRHTIGRLLVRVDEPQRRTPLWRVLGNPTGDAATFISTEPIEGDKRFDLFDASGRLVRTARFSGQSYEFRREGLPAGWYLFRVSDVAGRVCAGKIVALD